MERGFLTSRVFTPNNHYLTHIPYMIEQMGPLRFISCRASERNIKTHTRNIRSASKLSENASNNILKREVLQSCGIKESMDEQPHVTNHPHYGARSCGFPQKFGENLGLTFFFFFFLKSFLYFQISLEWFVFFSILF